MRQSREVNLHQAPYYRVIDSPNRSTMFADAVEGAGGFTRAVLAVYCVHRKEPEVGLGAMVVINREGWAITAAHVLEQMHKIHASYNLGKQVINDIEALKTARIDGKEPKRRIEELKRRKRSTVENFAIELGFSGCTPVEQHVLKEEDIALIKLSPFDPAWVPRYPVIKNPENELRPGTSLCRLGYPLYHGKLSFDEDANSFDLPRPPLFPIDGIYTRHLEIVENGRRFPAIETSSPGLLGHSGGSIFDREGIVWGIQTRTVHFDLGFAPDGGQGPKQYLHAGVGTHPMVLTTLLEKHGVSFEKEPTNA